MFFLFCNKSSKGAETCNSNGRCLFGTNSVCGPPSPTPYPAPCDGKVLKVEITADKYPTETSWSLVHTCTEELIGDIARGTYTSSNAMQKPHEYCADTEAAKYEFTINDSFGDGVCCSWGAGSYTIKVDEEVTLSGGEFAYSETNSWGSCGVGPQPTPPPTASPPTPPPSNQCTTLPPTPHPNNQVTSTNKPTPPPTSQITTNNQPNPHLIQPARLPPLTNPRLLQPTRSPSTTSPRLIQPTKSLPFPLLVLEDKSQPYLLLSMVLLLAHPLAHLAPLDS